MAQQPPLLRERIPRASAAARVSLSCSGVRGRPGAWFAFQATAGVPAVGEGVEASGCRRRGRGRRPGRLRAARRSCRQRRLLRAGIAALLPASGPHRSPGRCRSRREVPARSVRTCMSAFSVACRHVNDGEAALVIAFRTASRGRCAVTGMTGPGRASDGRRRSTTVAQRSAGAAWSSLAVPGWQRRTLSPLRRVGWTRLSNSSSGSPSRSIPAHASIPAQARSSVLRSGLPDAGLPRPCGRTGRGSGRRVTTPLVRPMGAFIAGISGEAGDGDLSGSLTSSRPAGSRRSSCAGCGRLVSTSRRLPEPSGPSPCLQACSQRSPALPPVPSMPGRSRRR